MVAYLGRTVAREENVGMSSGREALDSIQGSWAVASQNVDSDQPRQLELAGRTMVRSGVAARQNSARLVDL